jgi:hypothetical protein
MVDFLDTIHRFKYKLRQEAMSFRITVLISNHHERLDHISNITQAYQNMI